MTLQASCVACSQLLLLLQHAQMLPCFLAGTPQAGLTSSAGAKPGADPNRYSCSAAASPLWCVPIVSAAASGGVAAAPCLAGVVAGHVGTEVRCGNFRCLGHNWVRGVISSLLQRAENTPALQWRPGLQFPSSSRKKKRKKRAAVCTAVALC